MILHLFILLIVSFKISYGSSGVFWHITDVHLNSSYNASQRDCYGNYFYDSPLLLVNSAIDAMRSLNGNPDFILWNGDNAAHMQLNDSTFQKNIHDVSQALRNKFPSTNILPSLGNHDLNPANQMSENSKWCEELFNYWRIFFQNSSTEMDSFKRGCYYSRIVNLPRQTKKVLVLNTVIWYSVNTANKDSNDPLGQFQWMKAELQDARNRSLPVFIVAHVPPGSMEYSPWKYRNLHPVFNQKLVEILRNNSDIIEAGFFSHQHTDSFKVVYSTEGKPIIPLLLSPSVTPLYQYGLGSVNPSIRLYRWSYNKSNRFYSQYHTKLPDSGTCAPLKWTLEYNSSDSLPGLSASRLDSLLTDFTSKNSFYFQNFFRRHLSGRSHDNNESCVALSLCRCQIICGMKCIVYADLDRCLSSCNTLSSLRDRDLDQDRDRDHNRDRRNGNGSVSQMALIITVIVLFTVILIATVVSVNKVYCHKRRSASLTRDIFMAKYNGMDCEQIVSDHVDHIAAITFGDVAEYKGHCRDNSRTILLTLNDDKEIVDDKSQSTTNKFALSNKNKTRDKYDYSRM